MMTNEIRQEREQLLDEIEVDVRLTAGLTGCSTLSASVMAAMGRVPRHAFVAPSDRHLAYANQPLSIGHGQTISQPFIVALMSDLLALDGESRVLEIGTGSGYQAAVLAELAGQVYSLEIIPALATSAARRLEKLAYRNLHLRQGDGRRGWPEEAPFDAIMVTAAAQTVPAALLDQLKPTGRLVIPLGSPWGAQRLVLITKGTDGTLNTREILQVVFVPLTGSDDGEGAPG